MKKVDTLALILLVIGGLNWGIYGFFDLNVIDYVFGRVWIDHVFYIFIGFAAAYTAVAWKSVISRVNRKA